MHFNEPLPLILDHEVAVNLDSLYLETLIAADKPVILTTDGSTVTFMFNNSACGTGIPHNTLQIPLNITIQEFYAKLETADERLINRKVFVDLLLKGDKILVTIQSYWLTIHDEKINIEKGI